MNLAIKSLTVITLPLLASCSAISQKPIDRINRAWVENRSGYYVSIAQGKAPSDPDPFASTIIDGTARNAMIEDLIRLIDLDFENYTTSLRRGKSYTDFGLDALAIGLGTYGTLAGTNQTKTVLSALTTAIAGGRASFDKNVLFEQTIPVLIVKMGGLRAKQQLAIRSRMRSSSGAVTSLDAYPVAQALTDITEYYYAGTLTHALAGVAEEAAAQKQRADAQLQVMRGGFGADTKTASLRDWLRPAGKTDPERLARVQQWIRDNVGDISVPFFLNQSQYAAERAICLATLAP